MNQFKSAMSLFLTASLFSSAALAHVPMKDEIMPTAAYNWTGFYVGLNAGALQHTMSITDNQATSFNATLQQVGNPALTGGFQIGYRRQLDLTSVSGVYGVELSADFSNATFSKTYGSSFAPYQLNIQNELKNLCLLQFVGGIAANRTLLFMAAGLSWSNLTGNLTNQSGIPFFSTANLNKNVLGTALGGGIEYALNKAFSVRLKVDAITPNSYTKYDNVGDAFRISNTIVQGTVGFNYKFN